MQCMTLYYRSTHHVLIWKSVAGISLKSATSAECVSIMLLNWVYASLIVNLVNTVTPYISRPREEQILLHAGFITMHASILSVLLPPHLLYLFLA